MADEDLNKPLLDEVKTEDLSDSLYAKEHPEEVRSEARRVLNAASAHDETCRVSSPGRVRNRSLSLEERNGPTSSAVMNAIDSLKRKGCKVYYGIKSRLRSAAVADSDGSYEDIVNGNENQNQQFQQEVTQSSSLATSPSTHRILKYLIPPLLIINHILFYHAQTLPMWNLSYNIDIAVTATASTFKSKTAFDVLNLPHHYEFVKKENVVVETFTYMDAIRKLWKGEGLGDAQTISKVSAALLVLFSGIWPHLKLVLVHFCWFFRFGHKMRGNNEDGCCGGNLCCSNGHLHKSYTARSPFLRTLSIFGKWSLADVLVVCILIAVLHLDWNVDLDNIRSGVEEKLPTILSFVQNKYPDEVEDCKQLLNYECAMGHALVIHYPACLACETLIKNAFYHPEWTVGEGKDILDGITLEGGGSAQLRVIGMIGTYFFCGAVIMSILLSLVVDYIDEVDRTRVEDELSTRQTEIDELNNDLQLETNNLLSPDHPNLHPNEVNSPLTTRSMTSGFNNNFTPLQHPGPTPTTNSRLLKYTMMVILSIMSVPLVGYAISLPTMERQVYGGIPTLVHDVVGMVWVQEYSLTSLVATTGDAGGWDMFLMVTFGIFVVVGPILRSIALLLHVILGLPVALFGECIEQPRRRTSLRMFLYELTATIQKALRPFIDTSGAFCSWDVLIVALLMIQAEMPSITDTIYEDDRCIEADPDRGTTCIEVQFNIKDSFLLVAIAYVVLVSASVFVMDLATNEENGHILTDRHKMRYEYGMVIPPPRRTRANMSSDQSWKGALRDIDIDEINSAMGEQLTSSLLQTDSTIDEKQPLEEIVFV